MPSTWTDLKLLRDDIVAIEWRQKWKLLKKTIGDFSTVAKSGVSLEKIDFFRNESLASIISWTVVLQV